MGLTPSPQRGNINGNQYKKMDTSQCEVSTPNGKQLVDMSSLCVLYVVVDMSSLRVLHEPVAVSLKWLSRGETLNILSCLFNVRT